MDNQEYIEIHRKIIEAQKEICRRIGVSWYPSPPDMKIGISKNIINGNFPMPINGLRHPSENGTAGWYIWAGDYSNNPDFFQAIHIEHINQYFPVILKYLGLPPGWRIQIDDKGYEDIWEDKSLLGKADISP